MSRRVPDLQPVASPMTGHFRPSLCFHRRGWNQHFVPKAFTRTYLYSYSKSTDTKVLANCTFKV